MLAKSQSLMIELSFGLLWNHNVQVCEFDVLIHLSFGTLWNYVDELHEFDVLIHLSFSSCEITQPLNHPSHILSRKITEPLLLGIV